MTFLYDGASGGLGRHLGDALRAAGLPGVALRSRLEDRDGLRRELAAVDAGDEAVLLRLAALVSVPACEADAERATRTNVHDSVASVLEFAAWARARGLPARVLYVGSGHVYATSPAGRRIAESDPVAPRSVYARTKLAAEEALRAAAREHGFGLLVARVFGLVGPGQPASYVLPGMIRRARAGDLRDVPGLSYVRDYLDARDVCADLVALARVPDPDPWRGEVVNVCSGEGVTLRDLLREVLRAGRPAEADALLAAATEAPGRPDDVPWIVGDPSRFVARTGRAPRTIPLSATARDAWAASA